VKSSAVAWKRSSSAKQWMAGSTSCLRGATSSGIGDARWAYRIQACHNQFRVFRQAEVTQGDGYLETAEGLSLGLQLGAVWRRREAAGKQADHIWAVLDQTAVYLDAGSVRCLQ
jgi:hypothetical protein